MPIGSLDSRTEAFDYETWAADSGIFAPFSQVCNVTGQPAASLPVNVFDGELPAAVQLAGHLCHDHLVLRIVFVDRKSTRLEGLSTTNLGRLLPEPRTLEFFSRNYNDIALNRRDL
ncbi:MAG TPA: hypothetical protein DCF72_03505 [Gammaproteobacteria bacterium]|nr:hypothetical protein [Gammaproteobacteria bacterium]